MEKQLIGRGVLAGAVGGLLAFVFARIVAEPLISRAIDYEGARDAAQGVLDKAAGLAAPGHEHEMFSRTLQGNIGIGTGLVLFGAALGALFAVAYVICLGRTGRVRPRPLALLVAAAGFVGFYLVPFVKYPANPPAVGHEETIGARSGTYLIMLFCSVLFLFLAVYWGQKLAPRLGSWRTTLLVGAAFLVAIGIVMAVLPSYDETPLPLKDPDGAIVFPGFSADLLYSFRLYSIGAQVILWTTIALVFAPMAERVLRPVTRREAREPAHA